MMTSRHGYDEGMDPADGASRDMLVRTVAWGLRKRCGVRAGGRLVVAVSGGADSVALLRALVVLKDRRGWELELAVGHVQHHLRGDAAEADAQFVESLATELDLTYLRADLSLQPGKNVEAEARRERYEALATMARTFEAGLVATGHHADDQLETLLMRMLRGSSVTGLRGIAWRRRLDENVHVIRPMLGASRVEAVALLERLGQAWREDHTNADVGRVRAKLRAQALPVLREVRADAAKQAVALADHARQMHRLLGVEVARHHERVVHEDGEAVLDRGEARVMPKVVLTALLRQLLKDAGAPKDKLGSRALAPAVRGIRDTKGGQRMFELSAGVRVTVTRDEVRVKGPG